MIFHVIKYTIISNLRDIKSIVSYIVFPIILIGILGSALSLVFEPGQLPEIKAGIVMNDQGGLAEILQDNLTEGELNDIIAVKEFDSLEDAKTAIKNDEIEFFYEIPEGIDDREPLEKVEVKLWTSNTSSIQSTVGEIVLDTNLNAFNTIDALANNESMLRSYEYRNYIVNETISSKENRPGAIGFYSVTMMVMALIYGSAIAAKEYELSMHGDIGNRLQVTSISTTALLLAKVLSSVILVFLQGIIVFLVSKFAFNANWGDNFSLVILTIFLGALMSVLFGIAICVIVGNPERIGGLLTVLIPVMTFISGGFTSTAIGGILAKITPNYQLQNTILAIVYDYGSDRVQGGLLSIMAIILVLLAITIIFGRRRRA